MLDSNGYLKNSRFHFTQLRMERLELSKQKSLGPKSSASTNSATSVILVLILSRTLYDLQINL